MRFLGYLRSTFKFNIIMFKGNFRQNTGKIGKESLSTCTNPAHSADFLPQISIGKDLQKQEVTLTAKMKSIISKHPTTWRRCTPPLTQVEKARIFAHQLSLLVRCNG